MANVYLVVATKGKKTEYWAVAVPRHRALAEVLSNCCQDGGPH